MEIWKDIKMFEGLYMVSNYGRVKSLDRPVNSKGGSVRIAKGKVLSPGIDANNYLQVMLCENGKAKTRKIHQLVAIAFLGHKPNGFKLVINHLDHNNQNNNLDNLEITTQRENANKKHIKSSSKYVGVSWIKATQKWLSYIYISNKRKDLGWYNNEDIAGLRYKLELAKLNTSVQS